MFVWSCGWSVTLLFDAAIARTTFKQLQALTFATVDGRVIDSRIVESPGEITTYQAKLQYRYAVGGREWTGDRYRHSLAALELRHAERIVVAYPTGAKTTVYYNPANPAESLLSPGLAAEDFFGVLCLTPFNIVMVGSWILTARMLRGRRGTVSADLQVLDDGSQLRARPPRLEALGAASLLALPVSLLSIVAIGVTVGAVPSGAAVAVAWGAVIVAARFGYRAAHPAHQELKIDRVGGTLTLPGRSWRDPAVPIPLSEIVDIRLREDPVRNSENKFERVYSCAVLWVNKEGKTAEATWLEQSARSSTEQLVAWLREQCLRP
ncbi:MAG TPA: DUF3592 domain-containing protein [Pirellulales bacterium]|nr:DUF3592 domain-containing protein [Pirellulales bacterium]